MKYYHLKRYRGVFYYIQHGRRQYGFRITYTDAFGNRHDKSERGLSTVQHAVSKYRKLKPLLADKDYTSLTVQQLCKIFLERRIKQNIGQNDKQIAVSTYTSYQEFLSQGIIPYLGKLPIIELTPTLYRRKCLSKLADKLSHKSVLDINTCFKTALNYAEKRGMITHNPLKNVSPERSYARPNREQLSIRELHEFNHTLVKQPLVDKLIFMTLEHTGMRDGELLGLQWKDINYTSHTIYIRSTRDNHGVRPPKTRASNRNLNVSQNLLHLYKQYYRYCRTYYHNIDRDSFIVRSSRGNAITPSLIPRKLRVILHETGLDNKIGHFVCHGFRHEFASRLLEAGVPVLYVAKYLGHSSPQTTLKFYARALPGKTKNLSAVMEKLDQENK